MSEPSREDLARILCCPGGCVRDNECIALTRRELSPNRIDQINAILARLAAKPERERVIGLATALRHAQEKLKLYRAEHCGIYVGGVEFRALMQMIDNALKGTPA